MHPPDKLQASSFRHFYLKSSKFAMHNLKSVDTCALPLKILSHPSGVII